MEICLHCYNLKTYREDNNIVCSSCGHIQSTSSYLRTLRQAKDAVRNGYLYRIRLENNKKRKVKNTSYNLIDLNDVFNFYATAVISGIVGNFAYDQIKKLFKKIGKKRTIIEIEDNRLQSFLKSERQQEKFIQYINAYRKKKIKPQNTTKQPKTKKAKTLQQRNKR